MRKLIRELTFAAEIRMQITDLPPKLFIWPKYRLPALYPPFSAPNPSLPSSCYSSCRVGGSHPLISIKVNFRLFPSIYLSHFAPNCWDGNLAIDFGTFMILK